MTDSGARPASTAQFETTPHGIRYPSSRYARAFLGLVRAGDHLDRTLDAELRRSHGIGLRGFEVLLHLAAFAPDGRLPMTRLASDAPLSQSRVSRLVTELEQQGLVNRESDPRDTRQVYVAISENGLALLREAQDTHHGGLQRHLFDHLTPEEVDLLAEVTRKLLDGAADRGK